MTTDRRQQVLRLYHAALAREADDRRAFLTEACAGDDDLRRATESLLAHDPPGDFLETPTLGTEAGLPLGDRGDALIGRHIGAYRVDSRLGSGGMGDVYRATDTTLGRQVAIKVLPPAFALDPDRRARMEREAKALAALNHSHIAHVYGLETTHDSAGWVGGGHALVMELIDGDTLAQVLRKGPLPIDDALRYSAQIADALAAAHAHGIVHRDVKPANVMIATSGVKVLDFGLAKLSRAAGERPDDAPSPGGAVSQPHEVMGTVAYMSPEQAEGKPVDARSDVFSLGVVLYEMLCGQRPFSGDTALATLAATLKSPPPRPRMLRKEIPADIERIVLRCLEKTPDDRYTAAHEVHRALNAHLASRTTGGISRRAALVGASLVLLAAVVGLGVRSYVQTSRIRWVETTAAPEISRLLNENGRLAAGALYRTAAQYSPASRALLALGGLVEAETVSFATTPPGARVYISDYVAAAGDDLSEWLLLGETPLTVDTLSSLGFYRIRAVKDGFTPVEQTYIPGVEPKVELTLRAQGETPTGMVWVPPTAASLPAPRTAPPVNLPGFWMDKYEVTNRQFKAFVDAGGYQKEEHWKEPFVKDGRTLSWREGVEAFRDATGRPGPAGWQLGTFPEGTGDVPVGGVSWYEAAAYAAFAGKSLPSLHEWWGAALNPLGLPDILTLSNFSGQKLEPVGANRGMGRSGAYDMAGNVKEWAVNPSDDLRRYLLGGAWNEEPTVFTVADPRTPFSRDDTFGFRCVRRITPPPDDALGSFAPTAPAVHDVPVDDRTFQQFLSLHAYDKTELEARVDRVDDSSPYWRRETVSFRAAYDNERVTAHLFLPKVSTPPYQIVVYLHGRPLHTWRRVEDMRTPYRFLLQTGRAVVIPALDGTLERGPSQFRLPLNQERERDLRWSKDLGRTLDYLETRRDIDLQKLAFHAYSSGATHGVRLIAAERRFRTAVFVAAGFLRQQAPETDSWNFAPRVRIPVLILGGRDHFVVPYETNQRVLFESLGTTDKVFKVYDVGHFNIGASPETIGETLDWLDKHLSPVN